MTEAGDPLEVDRLADPPGSLPGRIELWEERVRVWRLHWEDDP